MKQITILGATGFVGKKLIQKALDSGYKIKVLARDRNKLNGVSGRVDIIEGSYSMTQIS